MARPKHVKFDDCVYWIHNDAGYFAKLPEGYVQAGQILGSGNADEPDKLENGYSSFGDVGAKIYANPDNPYSIFLYEGQQQQFELYVSQELWEEYVMVNGTLYTNTNGVSNEFSEQPWKDGECTYAGDIVACISYEIPTKDFQTNIQNAKDVYVSEDENTVYVVCGQGESMTYVKLEEGGK